MGQLTNGDHVVVGHLLAGEHLGGGTHADDGEAEDPQYIGAKLFDERRNGTVEAVDDGGDGDDGHDADDDAEDGQAGAQLVGAQCVERHLDGFALISGSHQNSLLSATIGSRSAALRAG